MPWRIGPFLRFALGRFLSPRTGALAKIAHGGCMIPRVAQARSCLLRRYSPRVVHRAIIEGGPSGLAPLSSRSNPPAPCTGVGSAAAPCSPPGIVRRAPGSAPMASAYRWPASRAAPRFDGRRLNAPATPRSILREPLPAGLHAGRDRRPHGRPIHIAGFGTADEAHRLAVGTLRRSPVLVAAGRYHSSTRTAPTRSAPAPAMAIAAARCCRTHAGRRDHARELPARAHRLRLSTRNMRR